MKFSFENLDWKKVGKFVGYGAAALMAASTAINDQKKQEEFDEMKKFVSEMMKEKES